MINEAIKKIRTAANMGQIEFSKHLACTQSHLSKLERGTLKPSHELVQRIVSFAKKKRIKVKLEDLF